jgi:branched-chain amino acid transport system ATP-binding protein
MPTSLGDPAAPAAPDDVEVGLRVDGVSAGYGADMVIRDIHLSAPKGRISAVIGPNGSGKSTLLKAITGVIRVSTGRVTLGGEDITNFSTDVITRRGVGYVPQLNDVFPPLTVQENLEAGGYMLPKSKVGSAMENVFGIFPQLGAMRRRTAGRLSGGERKMLAIGRALMVDPPVLVLDEPTANLSPALARTVLHGYVARLRDEGVAVLLVEQRARDALQVSDWGYVMVAGQVTIAASARELDAREDMASLFLGRTQARVSATQRHEQSGTAQ